MIILSESNSFSTRGIKIVYSSSWYTRHNLLRKTQTTALATVLTYGPTMIRRRGHEQEDDESSSDDEEDAFSALSQKVNRKKKAKIVPSSHNAAIMMDTEDSKRKTASISADFSGSKSTSAVRESTSSASKPLRPPMTSITSSMKRHHKPSDVRKAKMDALLQELEAEKDQIPQKTKRFVPEKKGSFVVPGEEHLTSNLFVGNLAPSIAEEVNSLCGIKFAEVSLSFSILSSYSEFDCFHSRILATSFRSLVRSIACVGDAGV